MCSGLTAPSGIASSSPTYNLFRETGKGLGKDSNDIGDECDEGKRETGDADPVCTVCANERPDVKGEGAGHSSSE